MITHRKSQDMEQQTSWIPLLTLPASSICGFPAFCIFSNHDFKICTAIYLRFPTFCQVCIKFIWRKCGKSQIYSWANLKVMILKKKMQMQEIHKCPRRKLHPCSLLLQILTFSLFDRGQKQRWRGDWRHLGDVTETINTILHLDSTNKLLQNWSEGPKGLRVVLINKLLFSYILVFDIIYFFSKLLHISGQDQGGKGRGYLGFYQWSWRDLNGGRGRGRKRSGWRRRWSGWIKNMARCWRPSTRRSRPSRTRTEVNSQYKTLHECISY